MSAVKHDAIVANYCEVTKLNNGKINRARVNDNLTGGRNGIWLACFKFHPFFIPSLNYSVTYIQGVINATGPFSDALLTLDNPLYNPLRALIALPNYYSPYKMGLLDPAISDGRSIFFLPTPSQAQPIRLPRFPGNRMPQRKIFAGYLKKSVTISLSGY